MGLVGKIGARLNRWAAYEAALPGSADPSALSDAVAVKTGWTLLRCGSPSTVKATLRVDENKGKAYFSSVRRPFWWVALAAMAYGMLWYPLSCFGSGMSLGYFVPLYLLVLPLVWILLPSREMPYRRLGVRVWEYIWKTAEI